VKLLLDHPNIDPNFVAGGGRTALMQASEPNVVKLLLDRKDIEVNIRDNLGRTALCEASCYNNLETAKLLLERKDTNINLPDNRGRTALFWACIHNYPAIVDLLLEKDDIDPNPRYVNSGRTPLAHICHYFNHSIDIVTIVRSLLSHRGTDRNAVDNNGVSILADLRNKRHRNAVDSNGFINSIDNQHDNEIESLLRDVRART
jgi:ankyrin repeat protein